MTFESDVDLLSEYAIFLEEILNSGDKKLSDMSIMEVVDSNFNAVCDYFDKRDGTRLNVVTESVFDDIFSSVPLKLIPYVSLYDIPYNAPSNDEFARRISIVSGLDVVYANMPINNHESVIRKLAMASCKSEVTAIFGLYSYKDEVMDDSYLMDAFIRCLKSKGLDYNKYVKETSDKHFELVMSKK